jgi:hypothetical protein
MARIVFAISLNQGVTPIARTSIPPRWTTEWNDSAHGIPLSSIRSKKILILDRINATHPQGTARGKMKLKSFRFVLVLISALTFSGAFFGKQTGDISFYVCQGALLKWGQTKVP